MKLTKTASGKKTLKISKKEWTDIGKTAGWMKTAMYEPNISEVTGPYAAYIKRSMTEGMELMRHLEEHYSESDPYNDNPNTLIPAQFMNGLKKIYDDLKSQEQPVVQEFCKNVLGFIQGTGTI